MVTEFAKRYADAVSEYAPTAEIYLFGSHAKGCARADSDIDIAVIVNGLGTDDIDVYRKRHWDLDLQLWRAIDDISYSIEPHLVDREHCNKMFLNEILETGIKLN